MITVPERTIAGIGMTTTVTLNTMKGYLPPSTNEQATTLEQ